MEEFIDTIKIGTRIKEAREKAGLTQNRLHEITDISITQLSAYENGKRSIGLVSLAKIAMATNTSLDILYFGKIEERPIIDELNKGKLIINCITALFDNQVIQSLIRSEENTYVPIGMGYYYQIGFATFVDILDDFVKKLKEFEDDKDDLPNPSDFRNQLIEAYSKKINDAIEIIKNKY